MINLLPPNDKRELVAARSNTLLIRYNFFLAGALAFLLLSIGIVYVYLGNTKATAERTIQENQAKVSDYADVKAQAEAFRTNLRIASQILGQQVNYSHVILEIAAQMPPGTILDNLSLDSKTFGKPTTLNARAKDYDSALALKNSFQDSDLFTDVSFESIAGGGSGSYPITVNLNVTIKKDIAQ